MPSNYTFTIYKPSTRHYNLGLPVWKQGDDLRHHLDKEDGPSAAFKALALQYESAAALCCQMASVCTDVPGIEVDADTHHIGVSGPPEKLDALLEGGDALLHVWDEDEGNPDVMLSTEIGGQQAIVSLFYPDDLKDDEGWRMWLDMEGDQDMEAGVLSKEEYEGVLEAAILYAQTRVLSN